MTKKESRFYLFHEFGIEPDEGQKIIKMVEKWMLYEDLDNVRALGRAIGVYQKCGYEETNLILAAYYIGFMSAMIVNMNENETGENDDTGNN